MKNASQLKPLVDERSEPEPGDPLLISAEQLAGMMNVSTRTLWRLRSAGKLIEPVKIGGSTRWRLGEVRRWITDGCPAPDVQEG